MDLAIERSIEFDDVFCGMIGNDTRGGLVRCGTIEQAEAEIPNQIISPPPRRLDVETAPRLLAARDSTSQDTGAEDLDPMPVPIRIPGKAVGERAAGVYGDFPMCRSDIRHRLDSRRTGRAELLASYVDPCRAAGLRGLGRAAVNAPEPSASHGLWHLVFLEQPVVTAEAHC